MSGTPPGRHDSRDASRSWNLRHSSSSASRNWPAACSGSPKEIWRAWSNGFRAFSPAARGCLGASSSFCGRRWASQRGSPNGRLRRRPRPGARRRPYDGELQPRARRNRLGTPPRGRNRLATQPRGRRPRRRRWILHSRHHLVGRRRRRRHPPRHRSRGRRPLYRPPARTSSITARDRWFSSFTTAPSAPVSGIHRSTP